MSIQEIDSGGLWGIESDSGEDYFKEVAGEQIDEIEGYLKILNVNVCGGINIFNNGIKTKSFKKLSGIALNNIKAL